MQRYDTTHIKNADGVRALSGEGALNSNAERESKEADKNNKLIFVNFL